MSKPSDQFLQRIIKYYKTHSELNCLGLWTGTYSHIREHVDKENLTELRSTLDNLYIADLWGLDYNQKNDWHLRPYEECFIECIDLIALELGMEYNFGTDVVERLESLMGIAFDIPEYPNRPFIKVSYRKVPLRFAVCYYIAYNLEKHLGKSPESILEIGAGTGYFPYIFIKKYPGIKYNVIDLPIISVIQTYIYATMVGEEKIWFHGEEPNNRANLLIYSPDTIDDIQGFDVALNHNSFPEMPKDVQSRYLQKIRKSLSPGGFFYSVNWEPHNMDQTPISVACETNKFTRTHRRIFPVEMEVHHQPSETFYEEIYRP